METTIERQRLLALKQANEVRTRRSRLKRDIHAGRVPVAYVLTEVPDYVATATVMEVLTWTPKVGRVKAKRILDSQRVSPSKTLRSLSQGTRERLVAALATHSQFNVCTSTRTDESETTSDGYSRVASTGLA